MIREATLCDCNRLNEVLNLSRTEKIDPQRPIFSGRTIELFDRVSGSNRPGEGPTRCLAPLYRQLRPLTLQRVDVGGDFYGEMFLTEDIRRFVSLRRFVSTSLDQSRAAFRLKR